VRPAPAEIAAEIRRLAREELALEWDGTDGEALASALDSLALLSLVVAVEDRFRIVIGEEEGASTRSLAELAALVARKLDVPASAPAPCASAGGTST
jgi:acyl carrier protein